MLARQRRHLRFGVGNILEMAGAGLACYAVSSLWGTPIALLVAGVVVVVAAELIYDAATLSVPLPLRPRPVARVVAVWRRVSSGARVARMTRAVRKAGPGAVEVVE